VTLGGQTFLDMQVAPHQAEASNLAKQTSTHHEDHEAMNTSASKSNILECGRSESPNMSINLS